MNEITCPLCSHQKLSDSWLKVFFDGVEFAYLECLNCHSLICHPMPDEKVIAKMYDSTYFDPDENFGGEEDKSMGKFREVFAFLETIEKGRFIDYGCGEGKLLKEVAKSGWDVLGMDFNPALAVGLEGTGIEVVSHTAEISQKADVLHLGDVLEHLTDLDTQMPQILKLLKSGGYFVAHGPLEANPNLFNWAIQFQRKLRRAEAMNMPPYHVILATSQGQRGLFIRFNLEEIIFEVQEVAFPAPESFSLNYLKKPRMAGLFFVRKISQAVSSFNIENSGNRYFYVGKKL